MRVRSDEKLLSLIAGCRRIFGQFGIVESLGGVDSNRRTWKNRMTVDVSALIKKVEVVGFLANVF